MTVALPLGRVGFVPRRDYIPGQECFPLDAVNYKNTLWACLARTTDVPDANSPNWVTMLSLAAGLAPGGGLDVNDDGLIFVAPDGFSEKLLEELMRRMRVPIWLTANTTWYVNASTGNDSNDGATPTKAFKTIQAALNHVCANFNMDVYAGTISVAAGTYNEDIYLPKYSASQGAMSIVGSGKTATVITGCYYGLTSAGRWNLLAQTVRYAGRNSLNTAAHYYDTVRAVTGAEILLQNVLIDCGTGPGSGRSDMLRHAIRAFSGSILIASGCSLTGTGAGMEQFIVSAPNGSVQINNDLEASGAVEVATVMAMDLGVVTWDSGTLGRAPVFSGTVAGPRAAAHTNGIINTIGSGGQSAIPGTSNGPEDSGGRII